MTMKNNSELQTKYEYKRVTKSKKNYQNIWKTVFLFISVTSAILINKIYIYQTQPYFDDIRKGYFTQLLFYGLPFGAFFILSEFFMHRLFDQKCDQYYINHEKYKTEQARKKRCYTLVKWGYSLIYYFVSSVSAYLLIKQTSLMPTWLGGNGYCTDLSRYLNTFEQSNLGMKVFYVLQFGKHLGRFIQHVFIRSEGNFYQYALHHGLSTFLIFFSYLMNMWLIGIFVLLIHDVSDIVLIVSRGYRDYRNLNKKVLHIMDGFGGFVWVFCRIFLLSYCCVYSSFNTLFYMVENRAKYDERMYSTMIVPGIFMAFMLLALQIMQIFWTYYIVQSFVQFNISSKLAKHTYD